MGACLFTKLKESVNNDNLRRIGEMRVFLNTEVNTPEDKRKFLIGNLKAKINITAKKGTFKVDTGGYVTSAVLNPVQYGYTHAVTLNVGEVELHIEKYYDIESFSFPYEKLSAFNIPITEFSNMGNIITISSENGIVGNIKELGRCTSLTALMTDQNSSKLTGTFEEFILAQIKSGRTSVGTSITITGLLPVIRFGGNLHTEVYNTHLKWDNINRIFIFVSSTTNIEDATKIYAKGATAEEIAAWKQAGKTVVVVS